MNESDQERLNVITHRIIGCAFAVGNGLGPGFLEKVYENALAHDLTKAGLIVEQQRPINVIYDNVEVGHYVADLLVNDSVLVEIKAIRALDDVHFAQCLNYLTATRLKLCLLLNFGTPKIQIKRIVNHF
jgi:GxxExxY protein